MEGPKNQNSPSTDPSTPAEDMACQVGHRDPSPPVIVHEVGGYSHTDDWPVPLFFPRSYILMENRVVTIEDTAIAGGGVAFALANNLTLPRDR